MIQYRADACRQSLKQANTHLNGPDKEDEPDAGEVQAQQQVHVLLVEELSRKQMVRAVGRCEMRCSCQDTVRLYVSNELG